MQNLFTHGWECGCNIITIILDLNKTDGQSQECKTYNLQFLLNRHEFPVGYAKHHEDSEE